MSDELEKVLDEKVIDNEKNESIEILDKDVIEDVIKNEIEENDSILEKDYLSLLVDQKEKLVYYEVENIYSDMDKRKYKNKFQLKKSPPTLIIKDDFGNEAIFYLTENLANELNNTLLEVKRAYLGFDGPEDMNLPDKFMDRMIYYAKNKPFKLALPIIVIVLAISFFLK